MGGGGGGIEGVVLKWFSSHLYGRSFAVELGSFISSSRFISLGVPQGSCLGPVLFSLYMLPLGIICQKCNVANHCYTDDIQLYLPLRCNNDSNISTLLEYLDEISAWMASSFLQFNESKSEVGIFGPPKLAKQLSVHLGTLANNINTQVRNLGVTFDSELRFDRQVSAVVKRSFYQLHIIAKLKIILSFEDMETLIQAFISSRLDYDNSLYLGLSKKMLSLLQLVQHEMDWRKEVVQHLSSAGWAALASC